MITTEQRQARRAREFEDLLTDCGLPTESTMTSVEQILAILKTATPKEIEQRRLFVVKREQFYQAMDFLADSGESVNYTDRFVKEHKLEAVEFSVGAGDDNIYFIATEVAPVLDRLWQDLKK